MITWTSLVLALAIVSSSAEIPRLWSLLLLPCYRWSSLLDFISLSVRLFRLERNKLMHVWLLVLLALAAGYFVVPKVLSAVKH